jgi:hypothetical protein
MYRFYESLLTYWYHQSKLSIVGFKDDGGFAAQYQVQPLAYPYSNAPSIFVRPVLYHALRNFRRPLNYVR